MVLVELQFHKKAGPSLFMRWSRPVWYRFFAELPSGQPKKRRHFFATFFVAAQSKKVGLPGRAMRKLEERQRRRYAFLFSLFLQSFFPKKALQKHRKP